MDDAAAKPTQPRFRIETADRASAHRRRSPASSCSVAGRCCRSSPAAALIQDLFFVFYHAGAGAVLEPARRLCRPGLGRPAGLRRARRLSAVRAHDLLGGSIRCSRSCSRALVAALFAVPTAFVVFRLRGAYFAIGTWVVAEVYRLVLAQFKPLGGGTGTSLPPSRHQRMFRHRMGRRRCSTCARRRRATSSPTGWRWRSRPARSPLVYLRPALAPRPCARRHPRLTKPPPKASASTASAPSSAVYVLPPPSAPAWSAR